MLLLAERVKNTIELGESHFREFKSAFDGAPGAKKSRSVTRICADIGEALVAFANADGGELIIGVEDDGTVTGVPHSPADMQAMLAAPASHSHKDSVLPLQHADVLTVDGRVVLFFAVSKGTAAIYQLPDGRCVRRRDRATEPVAVARLQFERQESISREYERTFVDGARVTDLDVTRLQDLSEQYLRGLTPERYLQQIGVAEYSGSGLRLRQAAFLLFAKDIQRWHPRSQVRILRVAGTELKSGDRYNVQSERIISGNVFDLLYNAWEELRFLLASRTEFGSDARFEQKYSYPELACREALINAIAHRDYSIHNGIDILAYSDRLEIKSPGSLLSTVSIADLEKLKGVHESRNAMVARVLRENKFMRELGEGMKRMFEIMEESELEGPVLASDGTFFSITFPNRSVFGEQQEQWLSVFQPYSLSALQRRIVVSGMNDRQISQNDIYRAVKTDDLKIYQREVSALRNAGILVELHSNPESLAIARKRKIDKADVPRFRVEIPRSTRLPKEALAVFVSNLPPAVTDTDVRLHFESCGKVRQVDLPPAKGGPTGFRFGFVHFVEPDAVEAAIKRLDGSQILNRVIQVRRFIPRLPSAGPKGH